MFEYVSKRSLSRRNSRSEDPSAYRSVQPYIEKLKSSAASLVRDPLDRYSRNPAPGITDVGSDDVKDHIKSIASQRPFCLSTTWMRLGEVPEACAEGCYSVEGLLDLIFVHGCTTWTPGEEDQGWEKTRIEMPERFITHAEDGELTTGEAETSRTKERRDRRQIKPEMNAPMKRVQAARPV